MALAISNIPILTGEAAQDFVSKAERAEQSGASIDFTSQRKIWRTFEEQNSKHIAELKAAGQWPF